MSNWKETIPALDTDKIRDLANEFSFDPDVLATELHKIAFGSFVVAEAKEREPNKPEARRLLDNIQNRSNDLKASIAEISATSMLHGVLFPKFTKLHTLENDLAELALAAGSIAPKRKKAVAVRNDIIINLTAKLWETLTGKRAGYTWDEHHGSLRGDFIEFLKRVAMIMHIDPAPLPERFKHLKPKHPYI